MKEKIRKDTSTGFLSISDLAFVYKKKHGEKININNIFRSQETIDRMYYLFFSDKTKYGEYIENIYSNGLLCYLKSNGLYKCIGRDRNKSVYAHVFIWCLIAQQIDPEYFMSTIDILQGENDTYNFSIENINYIDNIVYGGCPLETKRSTYFIVDILSKEIKIGVAKNLRRRFVSLKTANPHIKYLFHVEGDFERDMHNAFAKYRKSGEWFYIINKDILKETIIKIANLKNHDIERLEDRLAFAIERGYIKSTEEIIKAIRGE